MSNKNLTFYKAAFFFFISVFLFLPNSCKHNPEKTQKEDTTGNWDYLFNGESLQGWKITNFGTGGPVNISANSIILGMGDGCTGITWTGDFPRMDYEVCLEAKKISGNDFSVA